MINTANTLLHMSSHSDKNDREDLEASFSNLIKSPDAFVAVDYDFRFLFVNRVAEKLYRKTKAELVGRTASEVFPKEWGFGPFKAIQKNVEARKHFEINYNSPFSNQWIQLTGRPFENYFTFSYRVIDQKSTLNNELRNDMRKKK